MNDNMNINLASHRTAISRLYGKSQNKLLLTIVLVCCLIYNSSYAALAITTTATKPPKYLQKQYTNNLWQIIGAGFHLPNYEWRSDVQQNIKLLYHDRVSLAANAANSTPYLYFIYQQVKQHHLPLELVLIPVIESGYNPFNLSNAGAAGIWQMMPSTASGLGVKQDWWYDGRRDIIASTKAALSYLDYLFDVFNGNALLAIAAYNSGEGAVMAAIKRNIKLGENTDFWSLNLPHETKIYVPRLLALATIIADPEYYRLKLPKVANAPYLTQVDIGKQIDLRSAAQLAGISLKQLQHLNPGFNHLVTNPHGPYKLVLPVENIDRFMAHLTNKPLNHSIDWIQYKVKPKDTLPSLAKQFATTITTIKQINHLSTEPLTPGMLIIIPHNIIKNTKLASNTIKLSSVKPHQTPKPVIAAKMQPGDTLYLTKANDSIAAIARRFNISTTAICQANQLKISSTLKPGTHLLLATHEKLPDATHINNSTNTLYKIINGDTLHKIARKFNTTVSDLRLANPTLTNLLTPGMYIIIPGHMHNKNHHQHQSNKPNFSKFPIKKARQPELAPINNILTPAHKKF
jgi:membrane-bound lytic murein transglycosylase D